MTFLLLFAAYLAGLGALGWTQRRRAATPSGFYLGDRRFGAFPTGFSLAATTIGASAILTEGELVYTRGLGGVWMDLGGALGLAALAAWLVPRVRRGSRTSLAEIAGGLFGPGVRVVAAVLVVLAEVGWLALLLRGAESILLASGEVRPGWALALAVMALAGYTCLGGQHAVTWSDVVQFSVMTAGVFGVALPAALSRAGAALWEPGPGWNFPWGEGWSPLQAGEMLLMVGLPHLVGSDVYAKVLAARDERAARRGAYFAAAAKAAFGVAIALIALAARHAAPGLEPASAAVPAYLSLVLPEGLHMIVLLALMAAVLSSADTVLLTATTILLHDLLPALGVREIARLASARDGASVQGGSAGGSVPGGGSVAPGGAAPEGSQAAAGGDATVRTTPDSNAPGSAGTRDGVGAAAAGPRIPRLPLPARWVAVLVLASAAVLLATRLRTMMAIFSWAYSLFAAGLSLPILLGLVLRERLPGRVARAGMVCGAACAAAAGLAGFPLPVADGLAGCLAAMGISWWIDRRRDAPDAL